MDYMSSIPTLKTVVWQFESHVQEHLHNWLIQKVILKWHNTEDKCQWYSAGANKKDSNSDIFHRNGEWLEISSSVKTSEMLWHSKLALYTNFTADWFQQT